MNESLSNIRPVCPEHAPKPMDPSEIPDDLIGKHVKVALVVDKEPDEEGPTHEHIWVKVTHEGDLMFGTIANNVVWAGPLDLGDELQFDRNSIEAVYEE